MAPYSGRQRGRKSHRAQSQQVTPQPPQHQAQPAPSVPVYAHHIYANPIYVQHLQAPAPPQNHPRIAEESNVSVHDEADLISFRQDALARFVANQEMLENTTSRRVHTKDIEIPGLFAKEEGVYFGDLAEMNKRAQELAALVAATDDSLDKYKFEGVPLYVYQREMVDKLAQTSVSELEEVTDSIINDYNQKFGKEYLAQYQPKKFLVKLPVNVEEAPADYDPKDVKVKEKFNGDVFGQFNQFLDDLFKDDNQMMPQLQQGQNMPMGGDDQMAVMGDLINFDGDIGGFDDGDFLSMAP